MSNKAWQDRTESDIQAWWSPDDGKPIVGELVGLRALKGNDGRPRAVWVIETTESTMARIKGEDSPKEWPAGTVIGVGHRAKLNPLVELFATTTNFDVAIQPNKKVKINGGRTMWLLNVKTRGGQSRPVALNAGSVMPKQLGSAPVQSDSDEEGSDEIPF
jgi:hypothetical protein